MSLLSILSGGYNDFLEVIYEVFDGGLSIL
jgi:hypothetical protein